MLEAAAGGLVSGASDALSQEKSVRVPRVGTSDPCWRRPSAGSVPQFFHHPALFKRRAKRYRRHIITHFSITFVAPPDVVVGGGVVCVVTSAGAEPPSPSPTPWEAVKTDATGSSRWYSLLLLSRLTQLISATPLTKCVNDTNTNRWVLWYCGHSEIYVL